MSRHLVSTSSQYLSTATAVITTVPFTFMVWHKPNRTTGGTYELMSSTDNDTSNNEAFRFEQNLGSGVAIASRHTALETGTASGGTGLSLAWHNIIGTMSSGSTSGHQNSTLWIDGSSVGTLFGTAALPTGLVNTSIGAYLNSGGNINFGDGDWAHVAIWNIALGSTDVASLAAGRNPLTIQAANLVGYWPLVGTASPEPDSSTGGHEMTLFNSPTQGADDPTVDAPPGFIPYSFWPQAGPILAT